MAGINEVGTDSSQIKGALRDAIEQLDLNKEVTFQAYTRCILPIDQYVFWQPTVTLCAKGSLHISQEFVQNEDESLALATVVFTSEVQVAEFACSPTSTIFVACAGELRYSFSSLQPFYQVAGLWHYFGHNVAPAMASQLLDKPGQIDITQAVVSNSLPIWLAMNGYKCPYYDGFSNDVTLMPSFITPPNLVPPYASVHIGNGDTEALQATPYVTPSTRSHYQLVSDRVRITLYGLQNNAAMDFVDFVNQYSLDTGNFGVMNMAVINDDKRIQTEVQAIGMKKIYEIRISYYQARVNDIARQLILKVVPTYYLGNLLLT